MKTTKISTELIPTWQFLTLLMTVFLMSVGAITLYFDYSSNSLFLAIVVCAFSVLLVLYTLQFHEVLLKGDEIIIRKITSTKRFKIEEHEIEFSNSRFPFAAKVIIDKKHKFLYGPSNKTWFRSVISMYGNYLVRDAERRLREHASL